MVVLLRTSLPQVSVAAYQKKRFPKSGLVSARFARGKCSWDHQRAGRVAMVEFYGVEVAERRSLRCCRVVV